MTGYASPLNSVYRYADRILCPGSMILTITRCKYATLAEMARNAGDLLFAQVGRRNTRLKDLASLGLVRRVAHLRRWELTADGWRLLVNTEAAWTLAQERAS